MLIYENNKLTIDSPITNADSIIKLTTTEHCEYIGMLTMSNKANLVLNFIKEGNFYKARLLITEENIPYLNNCTLHLVLIDGGMHKTTNTVKVEFDIPKVKRSVKVSASQDIKDIKVSIAQLTSRLEDVIKHAPSFMVQSSTPINSEFVKPGMIPVAIDETGRCIFQYPFIDHITEINGQKTVNNAILITAKDIPVEQTDVESALKAHTSAIKELHNLLKTISSELKSTKNKVADIEKALLQHTDSSII